MSVENLPPGREHAIETLIDTDPRGAFIRASGLLEESVPQVLLQRPNLITKSALVDQALSLAKYEIDTLEQYDAVYGPPPTQTPGHTTSSAIPTTSTTATVEPSKRSRIVRHHQKMLAAKRANRSSRPSPQLVAGLRHLYGESESLEFFALLQSIMEHSGWKDANSAVEEETDDGSTRSDNDTRKSSAYPIEALIANLSQLEDSSGRLQGLLILLMSMVTSYQITDTGKSESQEQPDPSNPPLLQVGSILSVVRSEEGDRNPWSLDADFLSYLGDAAAIYEERIEIQKERLLSRLDDTTISQGGKPAAQPLASSSDVTSPVMMHSPTYTPHASGTLDVIPGEDTGRDSEEAAAAALTAAVFESIISAASQDEMSSDDDGAEDAEDDDDDSSDSDPDSDYDEQDDAQDDGIENHSSSSSSSESDDDEDGERLGPHEESGEENDDADRVEPEVALLRRIFASDLSGQAEALRVDTTELSEVTQSPAWTPGPITPGTETPISKMDYSPPGEPGKDSPLPALPPRPKVYPYSTLLNTDTIDSDHQIDTGASCYDPGVLNRFGLLPTPHVLMHMLRYTLERLELQKFQYRAAKNQQSREYDVSKSTVVGGMCASLFPPSHHAINSMYSTPETASEVGLSFEMLVSLFLLIHGRRNDAIENLKTATAREKATLQAEGSQTDLECVDRAGSDSEEGDDPAIALALHYVDDDTESKESLEAKGMHRKAAAAAHDAAAVLKSLRRRTEAWKEQVSLFSHCALLSIQCLQTFLQSVVRRWLQDRRSVSVTDFSVLLPKSLIAKLSDAVESVATSLSTASDATFSLTDDESSKVFLPIKLYQSATLLWGEMVPIVYPAVSMQVEALRSRLVACTKNRSGAPYHALERMMTSSLSESESNCHRLHVLCRRLRVSDALDHLVSRPVCYVPTEDRAEEASSSSFPAGKPERSSTLIASMMSLSRNAEGLSGELQNLCLALCHRNHVRILLWDGLYASSDPEMEETASSLTASSSDNVRINAQPSDSLALDGTKCADSMAILPNTGEGVKGSSANQRASKVWGTVLSSTSFSPKTGVHRWAVRLDKCERGHVFIGVATAQATTRTYVGGDKYGWGMIGTQALWHDRRKIRGDYGATFRTGSTIIVTLDTDAGTLSFSSWKEGFSSSLDSVVSGGAPSNRQVQSLGAVENWGVAFEGLPLDSRLFPAVGLYQRDDRVTLLTVESGPAGPGGREGALDLSGGLCYYPPESDVVGTPDAGRRTRIRRFNDLLSWEGVEYAISTLGEIVHGMGRGIDGALLRTLFPSLASSLSLAPTSIPLLSQRSALALLPYLTKCLMELQKLDVQNQKCAQLFSGGLHEGKWLIRATGMSNADTEEYVVDIGPASDSSALGFEGSGVGTTGRSKNGLVSIFGIVRGSSLQFVEEWSEDSDDTFGALTSDDLSSTCIVSARLGLDGKKFEGHYRNIQIGTTGQIAGLLQVEDRKPTKFRGQDVPVQMKKHDVYAGATSTCSALLALAHSHLSSILCEDVSPGLPMPPAHDDRESDFESRRRHVAIRKCLSIPLLANARRLDNDEDIRFQLSVLQQLYAPPQGISVRVDIHPVDFSEVGQQLLSSQGTKLRDWVAPSNAEDAAADVESERSASVKGKSSLATLCQNEYEIARRYVLAVIIQFCGLTLSDLRNASGLSEVAEEVWISAQNIVETAVRCALGRQSPEISSRATARSVCLLYQEASRFLLSLRTQELRGRTVPAVAGEIADLFRRLESESDLVLLKEEVDRSCKRGILRLIALSETVSLFRQSCAGDLCSPALEASLAGLPRLLGRGLATSQTTSQGRYEASEMEELDGHYLCDLPGASGKVCFGIMNAAHGLWAMVTNYLSRLITVRRDSTGPTATLDSMMLTVVASFFTSMNKDDVVAVLSETRLLSAATELMDIHRSSTRVDHESVQSASSNHDMPIVEVLGVIGNKEISRSIVLAVLGMSHVLVYQAINSLNEESDLIDEVLAFTRTQLEKTTPEIEDCGHTELDSYRRRIGDDQWKLWLESRTKGAALSTPCSTLLRSRPQLGRSGVEYLLEHGMLRVTTLNGASSKGQARPRSSPASDPKIPKESSFFHREFGHKTLFRLLHVVISASKSRAGTCSVARSPEWMEFLLAFTGVIKRKETLRSELIPGRFRARVIRSLLPFLRNRPPSDTVVSGLFRVAGRNALMPSNDSSNTDSDVSREAVSLLRRLHSPELMAWRTSINGVVSSLNVATEDFDMKLGVTLFFNGGPGIVAQGAYVLLKPPAACSLGAEQQHGAGKLASSGVGSSTSSPPHHVVGSGSEGIVYGLCQSAASAGIVGAVDLKNRLCEVILVSRNEQKPDKRTQKELQGSGTGHTSSLKRAFTIRAVKKPLTEVSHAQEVGLFLGEDTLFSGVLIDFMNEALGIHARIVGQLPSSADENSRCHADLSTIRKEMSEIAYCVAVMKGAISVLSDDRVLTSFLQRNASRDILSAVMQLDGSRLLQPSDFRDGSVYSSSISSLPMHESRWAQLVDLFQNLQVRDWALDSHPDSNWFERCEEYKTLVESSRTSPSSDPDATVSRGDAVDPVEGSQETRSEGNPSSGNQENLANSEMSDPRSLSQASSDNSDDDSEGASAATSQLREDAIAQMAELGLPRSWSELALRRTGGVNIEAAVHFCLERGGEMERLLLEENLRERISQRSSGSSARRRSNRRDSSGHLLRQLMEMGFPSRWCHEALAATGNNVDEALTWILSNGERLSAEDAGMEEGEADEDDEDDNNCNDAEDSDGQLSQELSNELEVAGTDTSDMVSRPAWTGSIVPLRFISGRSIIDSKTLCVSGLPTGGFSSVGTKGVLLTSGRWYYEAILETAGCLQIGWADGSFAGHCHADRGDGCGDGPSSWAFDGWRRYRWHSTATEWGCRWKEGDVVGCMVDMEEKVVSFTLNGRAEEIGMGVAFSGSGFRPCGGVYACVSFNRKEKLRIILGGRGSEPFKYPPPSGYMAVGDAVLTAVKERDELVSKEGILDVNAEDEEPRGAEKSFLCDFSDGEHGHELMAWAHRYYGSDASVHLGSARSKATGTGKHTVSSGHEHIDKQIQEAWSKYHSDDSGDPVDLIDFLVAKLRNGYSDVAENIWQQNRFECSELTSLYSRKLILHVMVIMGADFNPDCCLKTTGSSLDGARQFWKVIEASASLRSAGWVGEAGAMALAAETLGLGISSNDGMSARSSSSGRKAPTQSSDADDDYGLPVAGVVQVLSPVLDVDALTGSTRCTSRNFVANAEASIGNESGGGVLVFIRKGLLGSLQRSSEIRAIALASIRRTVRLLAAVEYDGEDSSSIEEGTEDDTTADSKPLRRDTWSSGLSIYGDARLASYITGLLLSGELEDTSIDRDSIKTILFEAWSVGMLSASLPWRMVCALTASGILSSCPSALLSVIQNFPTLCRFYGRLPSTVARRIWAERAASPVCSRYTQALIELLCSVKRSVATTNANEMFLKYWRKLVVDAATPLPRSEWYSATGEYTSSHWEAEEGWISSDDGYEILTGSVRMEAVDWKTPTRSAVRTLMDAGDGPPMLAEGCLVMRGLDWAESPGHEDEDGKHAYEQEKATRDAEKVSEQGEETKADENIEDPITGGHGLGANDSAARKSDDESPSTEPADDSADPHNDAKKSKKKKAPGPKLPVGTVLAIEAWNGIPARARRVRWHRTGIEGVYRYGGDGGRYDICHVEVNQKSTRVKKRHPLPESAEQCAARHGFGTEKQYSVLLRLSKTRTNVMNNEEMADFIREGVLEWPDFGAGIRVQCAYRHDGSVVLTEGNLLFGSKDSGWETRFGQPSYVPGTRVVLSLVDPPHTSQAELDARSPFMSVYEILRGRSSFSVSDLRNRDDGKGICIVSEVSLTRSKSCHSLDNSSPTMTPSIPPPLLFDRDYHAPSLSLSRDGLTVSCISSDGRGTAFASIGFTKGIHYWEVKLEQADTGSVFIGVAEKPSGNGSGSSVGNESPRLNRWHGWGFVNFRATYNAGAERIYGAHCHAGDTVGVLLDCDAGRLSFFFDGLKYGEHILNDLGCAFENLSPFGFNVDGCGSGGGGQGAPSTSEGGRGGRYPAQGTVRPKALWPVIGLRNQGDRVTVSPKWSSSYGCDGVTIMNNACKVDEILEVYSKSRIKEGEPIDGVFPQWFVQEAFTEFQRWRKGSWHMASTRGSGPFHPVGGGLDVNLDRSPLACATASALLGLKYALLHGDRVRLKRSAGRILELAEEAVVLGAHQGRLFYRIVSQKSEGGSLTEGGGRPWFWDESEVVDGISIVGSAKGHDIPLPLMDRFRCLSAGGLKVVYEGGAVVRSDLEIFEGSLNLGSIPVGSVLDQENVLERRVNSCGVVRYRVRYNDLEGWISSNIRGGQEESIVTPVDSTNEERNNENKAYPTAIHCASEWFEAFATASKDYDCEPPPQLGSMESFKQLLKDGILSDRSMKESDFLLARSVESICDHCEGGNPFDVAYDELASAVSFGGAVKTGNTLPDTKGSVGANQVAGEVFSSVDIRLPPVEAILARFALIRAFNRRAKYALPWLSLKPSQEGSAILGGMCGYGASVDRAGRSTSSSLLAQWTQVPTVGAKLRSHRGLFFRSVKLDFIRGVTDVTTTPTPLSHDEYELPREIRTVRLNRLKARRVMAANDRAAKKKHSVVAQLHGETKNWAGAALRRGHVAKGHGGQRRAFKVKLIGEGVNDYSGPYRETFTDALAELLSVDEGGLGSLGVLDPTPNCVAEIGENRGVFMFSLNGCDIMKSAVIAAPSTEEERNLRESFFSLTVPRDEASREVEESLVFLGRIVGTAFRHSIPLDLPLPLESVWKAIAEEPSSWDRRLAELDILAHRHETQRDFPHVLVLWQQRMLNAFVEGLSNVLPVEVLPLLTGEELRDMFCGNPDVDVALLQRVVEYEGYEASDDVVKFFWETLREFTNAERKAFLQFVWARNRLPMKESEFEVPFKIQRDSLKKDGDKALPSASTCFFSLSLPPYKSKELLKEKLLFAIKNVTTMETDFQTNSAEIAEGYRAF